MRKQTWKRHLALAACAAYMIGSFSMTANAEISDDLWECSTYRDENNDIVIDFTEVQTVLPASWAKKCQVITSTDHASFYHTQSRELWTEELGYPNGGHLFTISFSEDYDFTYLPAYHLLGQTEDGYYFLEYPTDYQAYAENVEVADDFNSLSADVEWITEHTQIKEEYLVEDTALGISSSEDILGISDEEMSEYILPQSSSEYLVTSDLDGLSSDEIQMAINEIYARHHRKFILKDVQDYFNSLSWYEGTVDPDDFDVNVMNIYESANINLMVARLKELKAQGK